MTVLMKNVLFLRNRVYRVTGVMLLILFAISLFLQRYDACFSILLGYASSAMVFHQLMLSQVQVLRQKNRMVFFRYFLLRLLSYFLPFSLFFFWNRYLHFPLLLICLFSNQIIYVILMFKRSLRQVKKQNG